MKINPLRAAVARGEAQIGTWITMIRNPAIVTLIKESGYDFARLDMEHTAANLETVADMAAMARALDFPLMVRPPVANREWITRLLDIGVMNLLCPQIESAEHAAEIVSASRFAPMGLRGNGGLGPMNDFCLDDNFNAFRQHANQQVFIVGMLESEAVFNDLETIAAMDGIDALTIGPADLAQDMGVMGTPEQDSALDIKRQLVLDAAKRHGKTCSFLATSVQQARRWREAGALLIGYASDVGVLYQGFKESAAALKA